LMEAFLAALLRLAAAVPSAGTFEQSIAPQTSTVRRDTECRKAAPHDCKIYVISSTDRYNDGRVQRVGEVLGCRTIRAPPIYTNKQECDHSPNTGDGRVRSIFNAHRNVWAAISLSGHAERSMVLESDFWVGNQTDDEIEEKVCSAWARSEDFTSVGWCDVCPGKPGKSPCFSCATAYIMNPRMATTLATTDFCMAADTALIGACPHQDLSSAKQVWVENFHAELGHPFTCTFVDEKAHDPRHPMFHGVFQQDVERFAGVHNGNANGQRENATTPQLHTFIDEYDELAPRGMRRSSAEFDMDIYRRRRGDFDAESLRAFDTLQTRRAAEARSEADARVEVDARIRVGS